VVRSFLGKDGDPRRTNSVILETKNLRIESSFDSVHGQASREQKVPQFALGPLIAHQLEKQHRAAEVIVVCPERYAKTICFPKNVADMSHSTHDWALEIRKTAADQETRPSAPFKVEELQKGIKFTGGTLAALFPKVVVSDNFLQKHNIQKAHGKATLKYTLGMTYTLEINVVHELRQSRLGAKSSGAPPSMVNVVLYNEDWHHEMLSGVSIPRNWDSSFSKQFLQQDSNDEVPGATPGKMEDPLDHFLTWVDWIQKALDAPSKKSGKKTT